MIFNFYDIIGTMTGTSVDGIDLSLVRTDGRKLIRKQKNYFYKYNSQTRKYILEIIKDPMNAIKTKKKELDKFITFEHYKALKESSFLDHASIIGLHGQTIYHNINEKISIQLGDPIFLAELTKKKIIFNFRDDDIKSNGQGAPLAPIYHKYLVTEMDIKLPVVLINIGGVSNITYVDKNHLIGFDAGPGNGLMDYYMQTYKNKFFDKDGFTASKGKINLLFEQFSKRSF